MGTLSCLIESVGIFFSLCFFCARSGRWDAWSGRRMLLRMKTMRGRKCCIYAVHGLLSLLTGGNKPCWLSAWLGLISLTGESAFSEAPSVPPVAVTVCLKPEPQLCSYPEEPRHVPSDLQKMFIDMNWMSTMEALLYSATKWILFDWAKKTSRETESDSSFSDKESHRKTVFLNKQ